MKTTTPRPVLYGLLLIVLGLIGAILGAALPFVVVWTFGSIIPLPIVPAVHAPELILSLVYGLLTALAFPGELSQAQDEIEGLLRRLRHDKSTDPDSFGIATADTLISQFREIMGTIGLSRDISNLIEAEAALRHARGGEQGLGPGLLEPGDPRLGSGLAARERSARGTSRSADTPPSDRNTLLRPW